VSQIGYLQESNRDARSTEHKILVFSSFFSFTFYFFQSSAISLVLVPLSLNAFLVACTQVSRSVT